MEAKNFTFTFADSSSNTNDNDIIIAATETNANFHADFSGSTLQDCIDYLEEKYMVAVNYDELEDGEYTVRTRPKHRPRT